MSSEETRLWNIQSNSYFHVPMPKVPVPKVPVQNSNINLSIWQTSSDCDPLSIGSWVTQLWCLATQNPSLQTGEVFLFFFFYIGQFFVILLDNFFLFYWTRSSWQHFHSHHLERHWSHLHIQGHQWKLQLWQCWWKWKRLWQLWWKVANWTFLQGNEYWKFINKQMQVRGQMPKQNHICAVQKLNASIEPKPDWKEITS